MVKKKGQKNAQSKKKLDLAAAVEAAEHGVEELNTEDSLAACATKTENGNINDDETSLENEEKQEEEQTLVMNYNPPEEGPATEETGKKKPSTLLYYT